MRFWCVLGALFLFGFGSISEVVLGKQDRAPALNPKTYVAPGGKFELKVDPSNREGRGEGSYVLSQEGKEKWAAKLPFTLWEAGVTDEGIVCGYAYTEGIDGGAKPGEFLIVILDADGKVKLQQSQKRAVSRIVHGPTDPVANGLLVDGANDRMIVRVSDPDVNQGWESWLIYGISNARAQVIFKPTRMMKDHEKARFILDAKLAPGTPLVLLHWWLYDDKSKDVGARYTLVDKQGKPVWTLDLPKDYLAGGKKAEQDRLRELVRKRGGILASDKPGEFEIFIAEKSQRVRFTLEKDGDKWKVKEVSRAAFVLEEPKSAKTLGAPERKLVELGIVALKSKSGAAAAKEKKLKRIERMAVDRAGNIYALDEATHAVHVFDNEGNAKTVCELRAKDAKKDVTFPAFAIDDGGEVFTGLGDEVGGFGEERDFVHFSAEGKEVGKIKLPGRRCQVQPGSHHFVVEQFEEVCLCDHTGKIIREIERGADGNWLEYIEGIACGADGSIAILTDGFVNLYDAKGEATETITLPEAVGRHARLCYDGERIVVAGECGMLLLDKTGAVTASLVAPEWKDTGTATSSVYFTPYLVAGGKELLVLESNSGVLRRYGMI